MSAPSVWLVETLDAAGAAREDAQLHARALAAAGFDVRAFVTAGDGLEDAGTGHPVSTAEHPAPDIALAASAQPGGGAAVRHLPRASTWGWWPTGIAAAPRWSIGRRAPELAWASEDAAASCPGIEGSTSESSPRKRPVPLWDGEVVIVPAPLERRGGTELLRAFTAAAGDRTALDLVVLGDPQPRFEAEARAAGVGARVHFAGAATREAEHAWFSSTAALLVDADQPVSGGLVLRALRRGVPVVPGGRSAAASALRGWLAARGCLDVRMRDLTASLAWALARPDGFERRARSAAEAHATASLVRRLGAALAGGEQRRAA